MVCFLHESQYLEPVMRDIEAMLQEKAERKRYSHSRTSPAFLLYRRCRIGRRPGENKKFGEYGEMQKVGQPKMQKALSKVTSTPLRVYYK